MTESDVLGMRPGELRELLAAGHPLAPDALDDSDYRGVSLGLPAVIERLTWKTFRKCFHRDPLSGALRGWNVRLRQTGVLGASVPERRADGAPVTFGHFVVAPLEGSSPRPARAGVLLDYGQGEGRASTLGALRDPVVALHPGSADLLLGWSYLALGPFAVPTPSYFLLRREGPLSRVVPPKRRR